MEATIRRQNKLLQGWHEAYMQFTKTVKDRQVVNDELTLHISDLALLFKPAYDMQEFLAIMHKQLDILHKKPTVATSKHGRVQLKKKQFVTFV